MERTLGESNLELSPLAMRPLSVSLSTGADEIDDPFMTKDEIRLVIAKSYTMPPVLPKNVH